MKRIFLIVLDSFGIGGAPDAADFGDEGSNTLRAVMQSQRFLAPPAKKTGPFCNRGNTWIGKEKRLPAAFGRLTEASRGKDTTIGHWEDCGHPLHKASAGLSRWISSGSNQRFPAGGGPGCAVQ